MNKYLSELISQQITYKSTNIWKFSPIKKNMNKSKHKLTPDRAVSKVRFTGPRVILNLFQDLSINDLRF